jgi:hypothetical protein
LTACGLGIAICAYSRAPYNLVSPAGIKETAPYNLVSPVGIKETAPYNLVSPAGIKKTSPPNLGNPVGMKETSPYNLVSLVGIHHHVNRKPNNRTLTSGNRAHRPVQHIKIFKNKPYKKNISTGYSPIPLTHIAAIILKERNTA